MYQSLIVLLEYRSIKIATLDTRLVKITMKRERTISGIHLALLKILFIDIVSRVASFRDVRIGFKESKYRQGRKRDTDNVTRELKIDT